MKSFTQVYQIGGQEIEVGLDADGYFHIGPTGILGYDATCGIIIKTSEDRVALGRLLCEIGSKLATPKLKRC